VGGKLDITPKNQELSMGMPQILDLTKYLKKYELKSAIAGLEISKPQLDLDKPGLTMHGSEADPYTILKYGLAPQQTKCNAIDNEWQICLGLNSKSPALTIRKSGARKNSAVKYAGHFSEEGIVYVVDEEVKNTPGYREYWDAGDEARGYAWITKPILPPLIAAIITENVELAAAAQTAAQTYRPTYKPDGTCYTIRPL
jgi:hypothetical protein